MKTLWTILLLAAAAHADSLTTFALQQPSGLAPSYLSSTNVQLGQGTPLLTPTLITPYLSGNYLAFFTTLEPASGPMTMTLTIAGITYDTGAQLHQTGSCVMSFALPRTFYRPRPGLLTVSFGNQSQSFAFSFIDPVPEPSTWLLMFTGCCLMAAWRSK